MASFNFRTGVVTPAAAAPLIASDISLSDADFMLRCDALRARTVEASRHDSASIDHVALRVAVRDRLDERIAHIRDGLADERDMASSWA